MKARQVVKRDPEGRFLRQLRPGQPSDYRPDLGPCLLFIGSTKPNGYCQFRYLERGGYAHRYAWERAYGAIPAGMTVDHLCMVKRCVEITHLELVTGEENFRRYLASRRVCNNGLHPLPEGGRCPMCVAAQRKRGAARRTNAARGLPNRKIRYDQELVRRLILDVRFDRSTIAQAAREIGCNPNYLGRRIWRETKQAVLARDGKCLRCGTTRGTLDAHHRTPRGAGGTNVPRISFGMDNLVTLCRLCHDGVESQRTDSIKLGWIVPRGIDAALAPLCTVHGWQLLNQDGTTQPLDDPNPDETAAMEAFSRLRLDAGQSTPEMVGIFALASVAGAGTGLFAAWLFAQVGVVYALTFLGAGAVLSLYVIHAGRKKP